MSRWGGVILGAACAACGSGAGGRPLGDVGDSAQNDTDLQIYDRTFEFDSPARCSPFVVERVVDGYSAEYDARATVAGETIQATYSIVPSNSYPVQLKVNYGARGEPLFSVRMGPHDLQVLGADGAPALTVLGYDGDGPAVVTSGGWTDPTGGDATILSDAAIVLQCMLPVQPALGAIPSFFENRSEEQAKGSVVGIANDAPSLLASWDGTRTILGAYFTAAVCVSPTIRGVSWRCACPPDGRPNNLVGDLGHVCSAAG